MSQDLLLRQVCPHRTVREWLAIDSDFQTLRTIRDPASSDLQIQWNALSLPRAGVRGPAQVQGTLKGPFSIIAGVNDQILLEVSGVPLTLTLPSGSRSSLASILISLERQISQAGVRLSVADVGGYLVIKTLDEGRSSSIFLKGGTGHTVLGLPPRRYAAGTQVTPSWELMADPARPVDSQARVIRFSEPFKSEDDIFEVSYITRRESCRRCNSLAIEDDLRYNERGDAILTNGSALLLQEVEKYILTTLGSNPFHNIGSRLVDVIGSKAGSFRSLEMFIIQEVTQNLRAYQEIKRFQEKYQPVTDLEFLQRVVNIQVFESEDPTSMVLEIQLLSRAGRTEVLRDIIRLPSVLLNFNQSIRVR